MAVALLPPVPVLQSRLAALPEGGSGCLTHEFSCLGGGSFRHDLFPSHLLSSQKAVGAGSPSISMLVLYLSSSPSLNVDPSSWNCTVPFVLLRRIRANSSSQISSRFSRTLPVEDDVIGTFFILQWTLSFLCVRPKAVPPVGGFALILCALDWAHCGSLQDNNSQFLIRKVEIQQTKCKTSRYAAKSGKMNWSLGSNCSSETGNSKSPTATNNVLWKNKYSPVERGMRNPHCIQRVGTNLFKISSVNQEICSNTFLLLSLRLNTYILARISHWILFQHRKNSQGLGIHCVVQNLGIMGTW